MSDDLAWDPPDPAADPVPLPRGNDPGMSSRSDLNALTRLLMWGLVAAVVIGIVALLLGGDVWTVVLVIGTYAVVAVSQWVAAFRRARDRGWT